MQVLVSGRDLAHGGEQFLVGRLFQQVAGRALGERLMHVGGVVVHREDEDRRLGRGPLDLGRSLETAGPRHRDVKQNDVGLVHARHPHRLLGATRFVFDRDIRFGVEKATQARTDKRVVVNDQDADHNPTRLQAQKFATSRRSCLDGPALRRAVTLSLGPWPHHDDERDHRGGDDNECDGERIEAARVCG